MGLFRFLADMDSYSKISKKYGYGAGLEFLDRRAERERRENISLEQSFNEAMEDARNRLRFDMTNYLRINAALFSEDDKKYLDGIIKQIDYISSVDNANTLTNEWNLFCYKKEYVYYMTKCIKDNILSITELINKYNSRCSSDTIKEVNAELENLSNETDYDSFMKEYKSFMELYRKKVHGFKKIFKVIFDKEVEINTSWGKI